jgi:hypothetical protein
MFSCLPHLSYQGLFSNELKAQECDATKMNNVLLLIQKKRRKRIVNRKSQIVNLDASLL